MWMPFKKGFLGGIRGQHLSFSRQKRLSVRKMIENFPLARELLRKSFQDEVLKWSLRGNRWRAIKSEAFKYVSFTAEEEENTFIP